MVHHVFVVSLPNCKLSGDDLPHILEQFKKCGLSGNITQIKIYRNDRGFIKPFLDRIKYPVSTILMIEVEMDEIKIDNFLPGSQVIIKSGNNNGLYGTITELEGEMAKVQFSNGDSDLYSEEKLEFIPSYSKPNPTRKMKETLEIYDISYDIWLEPLAFDIFYKNIDSTIVINGDERPIFNKRAFLNQFIINIGDGYGGNEFIYFDSLVFQWYPPKLCKSATKTLM